MKSKKFFKIAAVTITLLVLLIVIAVFSLNAFLKSGKAKRLITTKIENAIDMPVEMGDFSASIFSGVRINNFAIKNPKDFESGYFLKTDSIVLKYNFTALLHRQIDISEISIVKPEIHLKQKSETLWNFSPMSSSGSDNAAPAQSKKPAIIPFSARQIQIIDGSFSYEPLEESKKISVDNFTLKARILSIQLPPDLKINLSIDKINLSQIPTIENVVCSMNTSKGAANIDKLLFSLFGGSAIVKGSSTIPVPLNEKDTEYDADISLKDIDIQSIIKQFMPEAEGLLQGMLAADVNIKGKGADAAADINLAIPSLTVQDTIKISQLKSNIHYEAPNFTIDNLDMNVFGGSVSGKGKGSIEDIKNPSFDFNFDISNIDAGEALAAIGQDSSLAKGKVGGSINAKGNLGDIGANGKLSSQRLDIKKLGALTEITAPFEASIKKQNKRVDLKNFNAKVYSGSIGGNASVKFDNSGKPDFSADLSLSKLEAGEALKEMAGKAFLTGKADGSIKLAGRIGDINSLKGSTDIKFRDGEIAKSQAQNILTVIMPYLGTINFVRAGLLSTIGGGKVNIQSATLENPKLLIYYGRGEMKLSNQKLSIPSHVSMPCSLVKRTPLISGAFAEEESNNNWCGMDFMISGTLIKPKTDLEDRLKKQAIGSVIENILGPKNKDNSGGGIEDLLKNIFD